MYSPFHPNNKKSSAVNQLSNLIFKTSISDYFSLNVTSQNTTQQHIFNRSQLKGQQVDPKFFLPQLSTVNHLNKTFILEKF